MLPLMPQTAPEIRFEEPAAFRKFTQSLVETAVVTGIAVRLYRALVLTHASGGWLYWVLVGVLGTFLFCAMVTAHLANYPLRRWLWRAPVFAVVVVAAEMATSALLIAIGREPAGSVRAEWSDWPSTAAQAVIASPRYISAFAAMLGQSLHSARTEPAGSRPMAIRSALVAISAATTTTAKTGARQSHRRSG